MLILKAAALPLASGGPIEQHLTPKPRPPPPEPLGQARNRSRGQNSSWCFFKQASLWAPPPLTLPSVGLSNQECVPGY